MMSQCRDRLTHFLLTYLRRSKACWTWSYSPVASASSSFRSPTLTVAIASKERAPMLIEYVLGGVVTAALLVYLTYALLRPEKF